MNDAGRGCLPDPARKAHWIAMTSNSYGDGSTRGFDKLPPDLYQPDPALADYPPPQVPPSIGPIGYGQAGARQPYGQVRPHRTPGYPPPEVPRSIGPIGYGQAGARQPYGQVGPYGPPGSPPPLPVPTSALPDRPRPYQQMLRGRKYRWWKPLLCLVLVILVALLMMGLAIVPVLIAGWITGADLITTMDITNLGPIAFIYLNLSLIVFIPASGLSIW